MRHADILQRAQHINSAGGYLRGLADKAKAGEFSVGPVLVAALKANGLMSPCRDDDRQLRSCRRSPNRARAVIRYLRRRGEGRVMWRCLYISSPLFQNVLAYDRQWQDLRPGL
jgi:hypothetical protein